MNDTLTTIKTKLQPIFIKYKEEIIFCYCFGSLATNNFSQKSDVDLAFYVESEYDSLDFKLTLYAECNRALKRNDIDVVILNQLRNLILAESIVRYGIILYESNPEVRIDYEIKTIHNAIDFRHQRKLVMGI